MLARCSLSESEECVGADRACAVKHQSSDSCMAESVKTEVGMVGMKWCVGYVSSVPGTRTSTECRSVSADKVGGDEIQAFRCGSRFSSGTFLV
jgi:hypothetical protein